MTTRHALLALLLATPAGAAPALAYGSRPQVEREFKKTLPLAAGKRLRVEHAHGEVAVKAHPGSEVRVHAWIRVSASPESRAAEFADEIRIEAESDGSGVLVRTRYPQRSVIVNISYSVDYEIEMPAGALLEVQNRFGAVSASGVRGGTSVENANGSVTLRDGAGAQRVECSFGAVSVSDAAGGVTVKNSNGEVTVTGVKGDADLATRFGRVIARGISGSVTISGANGDVTLTDSGPATISTSFGAIRFTNVKKITATGANGNITGSRVAGPASLRNSFGVVDLADVSGRVDVVNANGAVKVRALQSDAHLETSFAVIDADGVGGDLTADNANGAVTARSVSGSAKVKTSFAPVTLTGVGGAIDVYDQNGSIDVREPAPGAGCKPITLKTSFGAVKVALPESAGYDVDARTSFGAIQSDFPLTSQKDYTSSAMSGKIGDGRCKLVIVNSNGGLQMVKSAARR